MITNKKACFDILDSMKPGETFSSIELRKRVSNRSHHDPFISTCLRYLREYRADNRIKIVNISKPRSLYKVMP